MSDKVTVDELGKQLHECADIMRGSVDKGKYKDYILPLVFYAEMNRRFEQKYRTEFEKSEVDENNREEFDDVFRDVASDEMAQGIVVPEGYEWEDLLDKEEGIASFIAEMFDEFENNNPGYGGFVQNKYASVGSFTGGDGDTLLSDVIKIIDDSIYKAEEVPSDMMGEAFMHLVRKFAREEAGEYFTPVQIVRLMVSLLEPYELQSSFHDPAVGSGGMLIEVSDQIRYRWEEQEWYREQNENVSGIDDCDSFNEFQSRGGFRFTGQELNPTIASISMMNLALRELDGDIRQGNSLSSPQFSHGNELEEFDYIFSNFPFSESGWKTQTKNRVEQYGDLGWSDSLPHGNYGDFAFIMHMCSQLSDSGKVSTIIPHGVLFRNGDQEYREYLIENDMVEAIIGLPENLFESTGIPSAILILNKNKPDDREGEVFFFNADHEGRFYRDTGNDRNVLLDPVAEGDVSNAVQYEQMNNPYGNAEIKSFFESWREEERVSRVVSVDEIRENEYNLNIALYVDTTEPQEDISVEDTLSTIHDLETEYESLNNQLTTYIQQLNYEGENDE